ncbi:hypothetical protein [Propionibacterium freudenreichii]|nr:hypothetical protein [Propionibacterium freudenreichii]MCT2990200.1 hypothetical protein [Propionibacterium freudenreichii]MCT2993568.1 hypothetical protein [Propionibacterium freudenreichii]MDK9650841.1 hypothetical protein [Propionibacterium freudenreichii]MDK9664127.1 hypothetical protein [Propionibacterium freudenreichii]
MPDLPLYWMTPAPLIPEEIPGHVGWGIGLLVRSRVAVTTGVRWDLEGEWDGENRLLSADRATPSRVQVPVWAGPVQDWDTDPEDANTVLDFVREAESQPWNHLVHMVSGADPCDGTTTHRNWIHTEFPPPEMRQWVQEHRRWIDLCPYLDSVPIPDAPNI